MALVDSYRDGFCSYQNVQPHVLLVFSYLTPVAKYSCHVDGMCVLVGRYPVVILSQQLSGEISDWSLCHV